MAELGVNPPVDGYLGGLQRICRDNEILLILDEVITGFGRTREMFAAQRYGVEPDMVTFAKGVTSGYAPLGGVVVSPRLWEPFCVVSPSTPVFRYGATYSGHATPAAVALKHLEILELDNLMPRVRELAEVLRAELDGLLARQEAVVDVRVAGFLGGVQLAEHLVAERVTDRLVDLGFISRPLRGNTLQISPRFITTDQELSPAIERADAVIAGLPLPAEGIAVADPAGRAWARTTPRERASVLHAWWQLLVDHTEELAHLITREMGKPLAEARGEVQYGADFVRWYAEEAVRPSGNFREAPAGGSSIITRRAPVGLAVLITPWNFPLAMATRKIAPAIAAGCAAVVKPATLTPLTTIYAVELARRAGGPEDLVQVVTTSSSSAFSEAVLRDERVRKVSFTGSTEVGHTLLRLASDTVLRTSMELGGNAPLIVFDDADLERAIDGAVAALIDDRAVQNMHALTEDAVAHGAQLRVGGSAFDSDGHFFAPTLVDRVPEEATIAGTEIFGPIAAVQRFATQEEAIERANATELGLAAYVFTESLDRALNVADRLETGLVGINQGVPSNAAAPFGGLKQSGLGREGGTEGLEEYQTVRFFNIARRETN